MQEQGWTVEHSEVWGWEVTSLDGHTAYGCFKSEKSAREFVPPPSGEMQEQKQALDAHYERLNRRDRETYGKSPVEIDRMDAEQHERDLGFLDRYPEASPYDLQD